MTSSVPWRRRGVTLIEALAGLVILGTLLTAVTVARSRANHQYVQAQQRLAASRALDAQLAAWFSGPTPAVPLNSQGTLVGAPHLRWRTTTRTDAVMTTLHALVARVEVFDASSRSAVLSVEVVVPAPVPTTQPGGAR